MTAWSPILSILDDLHNAVVKLLSNSTPRQAEFKNWLEIYCLLLYCNLKMHELFYSFFLFKITAVYHLCLKMRRQFTVIPNNN